MRVPELRARFLDAAHRVIVGQEEPLRLALLCLLTEGHLLLEGVPGTAKTLLARAVARLVRGSFTRIQFTPDLMPSDLLGTSVYEIATSRFTLRLGPIFANIVLADEVNRAPAKTQSALLEAMEERQVTLEGAARPLPRPFLVLATQNPVADAAVDGRDFVTPDGVKTLAAPVLRHRFVLKPEAEIEGLDADAVVAGILSRVEVPR